MKKTLLQKIIDSQGKCTVPLSGGKHIPGEEVLRMQAEIERFFDNDTVIVRGVDFDAYVPAAGPIKYQTKAMERVTR